MIQSPLPILGLCAWSGTGKTTLLKQLLPLLRARDMRVGVIKHAHHSFEVDQPGKDSWELRHAGADQMLVASSKRAALMTEFDQDEPPALANLLSMLDPSRLDLILVEGFKREVFPKIELHRPSLNRPLLCGRMQHIIAVAADAHLSLPRQLPLLNLNDTEEIVQFIVEFQRQQLCRHVS